MCIKYIYSYDPAITLIGIYPKEFKTGLKQILVCEFSQKHDSNSQNVERAQLSIYRWMDKHNVIIHIYYSAIKGVKFWYMEQMNLGNINLSEISQTQKDKYYKIPLLWNMDKRHICRDRK